MNHDTLLLDASRSFVKAQGMNEILSVLTRSVAALVKDADMVLVYTYDHDKQVLQLTRGEGDISHQLYQVAFCPGESITGFVYVNQTTMLLRQPSDVEQAMANMSASNRLSYLAGVSHKTVHSSFSIPIIINDSCIATLTANRLTHPTPFTEKDLELVMELLDYAKFALEKEIQMQHATFVINDYQIKVEATRYFQHVLSESGDADHVVRLLRRRLPNGSVYLSEHPIHQHHSTPIRVHQQHTDWLVYTNQPHQNEAIYLEEAASAIGLLRTFAYQKIEEDLLKDEKKFADSLENHHYDLAFWDMPSNTPVVCLVMCGSKGNQLKEYQTLQKLFVDLQHRWKLIFYKQKWVLYLEDQEHARVTTQLLSTLLLTSENKIGLSRTEVLSHFHLLFQDASNTWHVAKEGQIQSYSKLGFERLLPSINWSQRDAFIKDHLQTLPDYPYLMNTLIAFIAHSRNRKETARALYIHPNTLYQRLKKVEDETSKCIDQEDDWLNLMIAVAFYKLVIPN